MKFSEGLIVAYLTFLGYAVAFSYQVGYASAFGIQQFVTLNLTNIFLSIVMVAIFLILFAALVDFIVDIFPFSNIQNYFSLTIMLAIILMLLLMGDSKLVIIPTVFFIFVLACEIIACIIDKNKNPGGKSGQTKFTLSIEIFFHNSLGKNIKIVFLITVFIIISAYLVGNNKARNETEFLILNTTPEYVVLAIYDDNIIVAPINRNTNTVYMQYKIYNIRDSSLIMKMEEVGPLIIERKASN